MEKTSWRVERTDLGDFVRFALVGRCADYEHGFAVYSDITAAKRRTLREMFRQDFARHLRVKALFA